MKKYLMLTLILLFGLFAVQKDMAAEVGDANGDGVVNAADVVAVVNATMDKAPEGFDKDAADMNGDGDITEEDATMIAMKIMGPSYDLSQALVDDYERAFAQGYLAPGYYYYDRKQQITSQQFKALLKQLVEKFSPDKMDDFNTNITDHDILINRGAATVMVYYTAKYIGVATDNVQEMTQWVKPYPEDMWDDWDMGLYHQTLPHAHDAEKIEIVDGETIVTETCQMACGWNDGHWSYYSKKEIVEMDFGAISYHWTNPFTWEEAVRAITRLYDSFKTEIEYVDIDDLRVTTPDATVITPELIAYAAKKEIHNIDDLPRQIGFFCGEGMLSLADPGRYGLTAKEFKEYADWGFNSVKYVSTWNHIFTNDMQVNLNVLKSLDEMVAASMQYGIHLSFGFCFVPGFGMYFGDSERDDYIMDTDILNAEKRKKACDIWRTLALRYKDVPNISLSFCPVQEITALSNPSGFGEGQSFTLEQILGFVDILIDAIKKVTPERFIIYDAYSHNLPTKEMDILPSTKQQYQHMFEKYNNTRMMNNYMDAYLWYEYSQGDGNIDYAHHSVWVPTYPLTLYGANSLLQAANSLLQIDNNDKLTIDGCLPKGTILDFYLSDAADGTDFQILADDKSLHEESIEGDQDYHPGVAMYSGDQFKTSDKKITVTLEEDAKEVVLYVSKGAMNWCGIEVKLPESYTVERWWKPSEWDKELGLISPDEDTHSFHKKPTSSVKIGSTYGDWQKSETGFHITIHDDVTFTSDHIYECSNKENIEQSVKEVCENFPKWSCRFEDVLVTDMAGALNFWDDTMEIFKKYNIDVWISALGLMTEENLAPYRIADYEGEDFNDHHNFNVKLLRVLQKYMDK